MPLGTLRLLCKTERGVIYAPAPSPFGALSAPRRPPANGGRAIPGFFRDGRCGIGQLSAARRRRRAAERVGDRPEQQQRGTRGQCAAAGRSNPGRAPCDRAAGAVQAVGGRHPGPPGSRRVIALCLLTARWLMLILCRVSRCENPMSSPSSCCPGW